jgi:2-methylcitrate dehydratase PrpD
MDKRDMDRDQGNGARTARSVFATTRRGVMHGGGVIAAAALLPAVGRAAPLTAVSPEMTRLSSYMSEAGTRALPAEAAEKAKHHILDTIGAMISGAELPPGQVALRFARSYAGQQVATVVASNIVAGPLEAALANGMLAHSDETDDSHAASHCHPGCAIVSAALAAGEQFGIDGKRFLHAVTLGYDVGPRVTMMLGGLKYQMETHRSTHSIASTFGAAAAAGCAAGLDAQQMRWLLDYAGQQASGIAAWQRDIEHVEKSLVFGGMPARNGVNAALLIQLGSNGVPDIFSGSDNFLMAFAPNADPKKLVDQLGERYEVTRTNIKKWTVGSPIQAPLDAVELIRQKRAFTADQVKSVVVRVASSDANTVNNRDMPDICLQHMVAVMLIDKTASFRAAHDKPRMQDPAVLAQRAKVQLVFDEELERLSPRRISIVEITFNDGSRLTEQVEKVRGTVQNPMTREEVVAKASDLVTPTLGAAKAKALVDTILDIDNVKSIRDLRPLLQRS